MKLAVLSESPADEAAVSVLSDAVSASPIEVTSPGRFRTRSGGWPSVLNTAPILLTHLHYRTDANGLVIVVDSNHSPCHTNLDAGTRCDCRMCLLRERLAETSARLARRPSGPEISIAVGLAVPAIEAWYRCGNDPHVSEAAWCTHTAGYTTRRLKEDVYGTQQPSLDLETRVAVREASRVAGQLGLLEQSFPQGFGALATDIRGWPMQDC
jgi:hypothetical protein